MGVLSPPHLKHRKRGFKEAPQERPKAVSVPSEWFCSSISLQLVMGSPNTYHVSALCITFLFYK